MTCCGTPALPLTRPRRPILRLVLAIVLAGNCMGLSLAVNISDLAADERCWLHGALIGLTALVALLVGGPLASGVASDWQRASIEAVFLTGISGAAAFSLHSVWAGTGHVYFEVICILLVIYAASCEVKQVSRQRTLSGLRAAMPGPPRANRLGLDGRAPQSVPVADLAIGDHLLVHAGEVFPLDGVVVQGVAFVNEAALTGEGALVRRGQGDRVRAGTRNLDGELRIRATTHGSAQALDDIAKQVLEGFIGRGELERQVDRVARWFFPAVAVTSATTFLGWWLLASPTDAFLNAMAVLLVACPCSMGFATPVGLWAAWIELARLGLVTPQTSSIERLAAVDTVLFDKTGTLTHMEMSAGCCKVLPGAAWTEAQAVELASVAQSLSDHPIAQAFRAFGASHPATYRPVSVRPLPGIGIEAQVLGVVGGQRWCLRMGDPERLAPPMDTDLAAAVRTLGAGARPLALLIDGRAIAVFAMVERPVAGAAVALAQLSGMGLACSICSGDIVTRLQPWAPCRSTGFMTAAAKASHVSTLTERGHRVCFVGDGLNDAPAMARSHVSLAIASGSRLANLAADFTLTHAALPRLPEAVKVARKAMQIVRSNLALAAGYNALGIGMAAAGKLHPVGAAILMLCSSLTVTWRASAWAARKRA